MVYGATDDYDEDEDEDGNEAEQGVHFADGLSSFECGDLVLLVGVCWRLGCIFVDCQKG